MLKIGISSGLVYTKSTKRILPYIEKDLLNFISQKNVLPVILPLQKRSTLKKIIENLDGVVLSGGTDIAPTQYGVKNKKILEKWPGDPVRDRYEFEVVKLVHQLKKPIFGICRGLQVLNVFFGGTLYQDLTEQMKTKIVHNNKQLYDKIYHKVSIKPKSLLEEIYPRRKNIIVNTLHHQGIKKLASGFQVDGVSQTDHLIEAISMRCPHLIMAVQWHPEFSSNFKTKVTSSDPLWDFFLNECLVDINEKKV